MISFKINVFSNVLNMNNDLWLLVPDTYESDESLKTLWLYHGGSGDENEWLFESTIANIPDDYHLAIILVNAEDSCFVDMAYGRKFTTYLGEELLEIMRKMFPHLSGQRSDNFIGGLSNGGYGAFVIGLTYPEKFAAIGALSAGDKADASSYKKATGNEITPRIRMFGAEDIKDTRYSIRHLARQLSKSDAPKPRIFHSCGALDPWLDLNLLVKETFEEPDSKVFDYTYDQMNYLGHEWGFWDIKIRRFVKEYCCGGKQ